MAFALNLRSTELRPTRTSPFVFFSAAGLLWGVFVTFLLGMALARSSTALLMLTLVFLFFAMLIVLMTHENLSGIRLVRLAQEVRLGTGESALLVTLENATASRRQHLLLRTRVTCGGQTLALPAVPIMALEIGAVDTIRIPLPWRDPGLEEPVVTGVTLESRFPTGLARAWFPWSIGRLLSNGNGFALAGVPQPLWPEPEHLKHLIPEHLLVQDIPGPPEELVEFHNQNPARMAWIPSLRSGRLLVRAHSADNRECETHDPHLRHLTSPVLRDSDAVPQALPRVFALSLSNFRGQQRFRIETPDGEILFVWKDETREDALGALLKALSEHWPPDAGRGA